ncbi:hypothetical protein ACFX2J_000488 [Malus domestica]
MDSDEQPSSCSFPSPKLPRIRYDSCCRRFSNLRSNLSSALNSTQNIKLISNGSFSHWSLACLGAGRKCIKQGSSFLKMRANTLCNRSSLYEGVQETYSCFVRLTSSPEEDAVQMQPGSGETRVLFPNSVGDDVIIQVQNSKGQHCGCGHALVKVAAIADELIQFSEFSNSLSGDKIRWWPIYSSDLEDEPVVRIQLSMDYSSIPVENSNLKYGSIAETVVYDCVLEIAMKVQHFQERNLLLHGLWKWLLTEFASYYGVSKAYTNLRYLSYVMDVATPTVDCLTLLYDLLADVKEMSTNLLSHQEAKWSGVRTEYGTTHFVDYMHTELKGMLDEFEVIISRWPIYSSPLENVIADVEKAIIEALDRHYDDVLSPLKDNLTNKTLGFKYVQKLSRQSISTYSVPNELGILLNSMKRTLDVLWPHIESQLMSRSSCIRDGYATGEHLNDVSALLRTKLRTYRLAIVEKLYENTRVRNKTKLKNIIQRSKAEKSVVQSRMKPLEVLLREMIDHLHTVVDPTVFVELCREFWDRLGQDVLHISEDKKEEYKGLRVAVSLSFSSANLDDIFASEMQRLRRNSLKERDLSPPGSMEEVHSMLKDVVRM